MKSVFGRYGDFRVAVNIDFSAIRSTSPPPAPRTRPKPRSGSRDDIFIDVAAESDPSPSALTRSNSRLRLFRLDQHSLLFATLLLSATPLLQFFENQHPEPPPRLAPYRVDLNSAGLEELVLLEGIGELTAEKIVLDRQAQGSFLSEDDLQRVNGIGPKTMDRLRDSVVCR